MSDVSDFVMMVKDMMTDFGTTGVLFTQPDDGTYNPATATTTVTNGSITVTCIIMDRTLNSNGAGVMYRRMIEEGDKMVYVSPTATLIASLMPNGVLKMTAASDRFTVQGYTYGIVRAKVIDLSSDGSKPILFELYLRK